MIDRRSFLTVAVGATAMAASGPQGYGAAVPGSNFQYSGWTTEGNHLGNAAYRTGKKIKWDYQAMRATNAPEADPFIRRPECRKGWEGLLKA